jgi:Uncharacterised protein family (UPF0164)
MIRKWMVLLWLLISLPAGAQIGGKRTFSFLELPTNGKVAALGGVNISALDPEAGMMLANPALLQAGQHRHVAFSFTDYVADVSHNTLTYVMAPKPQSPWGIGLSYLDYGDFVQRDAAGQVEGKFSVYDYALSLTHASTLDHFTLGATVKLAVSAIAGYKAVAVLSDIGGIFKHPEKDLTLGLTLKNLGYQVSSFSGREREPVPLQVQAGLSFKPEHMPFRFSLTAHHLQQPDIVYLDTTGFSRLNQPLKKSLGDKIARHLVVGGELLLSKNLHLRMGYNHMRRKELRLDNALGAAGLSLGFVLRIRGFQLDYARAFYHPSGGGNFLTVGTDLGRFFKKKDPLKS